jgi:hypothetical protein
MISKPKLRCRDAENQPTQFFFMKLEGLLGPYRQFIKQNKRSTRSRYNLRNKKMKGTEEVIINFGSI